MLGPETPQQGVEQDVFRTYLMADAARKAGMAISDEYILNYLMQLGRGFVSVDTIRQIITSREVGGRQPSIDYMLDARASRNARAATTWQVTPTPSRRNCRRTAGAIGCG